MKTCKKNVYQGRFRGFKPCKFKAVKDGFCKRHHPEAERERQEKSAKLREHKFRSMFSSPIPDGWKLVPAEPTVGMYDDFCLARPIDESPTNWNGFIERYKAMLAAAPTPEGK